MSRTSLRRELGPDARRGRFALAGLRRCRGATGPLGSPTLRPMAGGAVNDLLRKYEALHRLRSEPQTDAPTLAMRALADEFPGALRELDELELGEIERRLAHLRSLAQGEVGAAEAWVTPLSLYHRRLRGALAAKRWLRGRRLVTPGERQDFLARRELGGGEAAAWATQLDRLARPPTGRVTDLVLERVAAELGLSIEALCLVLFGPAALRRPRRKTFGK